ncbi:hypothetical protein C8J56DRAFT_1058835 [Mycena floridula]|nr:hypothetical protein C8J56DRAFT_1058835 [Mycena floridula]
MRTIQVAPLAHVNDLGRALESADIQRTETSTEERIFLEVAQMPASLPLGLRWALEVGFFPFPHSFHSSLSYFPRRFELGVEGARRCKSSRSRSLPRYHSPRKFTWHPSSRSPSLDIAASRLAQCLLLVIDVLRAPLPETGVIVALDRSSALQGGTTAWPSESQRFFDYLDCRRRSSRLGRRIAFFFRAAHEKSLTKSMSYYLDKDTATDMPQAKTVNPMGDLTFTFVGFLEAALLMLKAIKSFYIPSGRSRTGSSVAFEGASEYETLCEYFCSWEGVPKQFTKPRCPS